MGGVLDLFNVLHEPSAVFARLKERPRVLVPWLVVSLLLIGVALLTRPFQAAAMETLRASLPPEQAARMGPGGQSVLRTMIGPPILVLISMAAGAGLFWIGTSLMGGMARYKTLISVLGYSLVTYVIYAAVTAAVLKVRGVSAVTSLEDLRVPLGLDLLVPGATLFLGALLNGINLFSIWGVWMCGLGISVTQGISRASATMVAAGSFLVGLLLQSLPLLLLGMAIKR